MTYCHTSRERERLYDSLILEYDKIFRIGKTHIQKEREYEITSHNVANREKKRLSKKSEKKNIRCDDRKRAKYSDNIMCFKEREKMTEPIKDPLKCAMELLSTRASIGVYHLDKCSLSKRCDDDIEEK